MRFALGMLAIVAGMGLTTSAKAADGKTEVDAALPDYKPVAGVSGSLKSVGSDTMNNLMTYWAEAFYKHYPNVKVEIEGKGSATAPPALIGGTAQFGPMSRPMSGKENDEFEKKYGYKPTDVATAIDVLAVFVHKDNPIDSLTFPQIDAIFSKGRRGGFPNDIKTWGDLGVKGALADKPISAYGRNSASGTYSFFKEHALFKGDFKDTVKEQPGSSAVVQGVSADEAGIGYSGIGYVTKNVKVLAIALKAGGKPVTANLENAYSGDYPLTRALMLYVNKKPGEDLDPLRKEFLRFALSKQGQQIVVKDDYIPLPADVVAGERKKLGIKE